MDPSEERESVEGSETEEERESEEETETEEESDSEKGSETMEELLKRLEESGAKNFVDEDFPADDSSIGREMDEEVVWLRASEFMEGEPHLFADGISPNDILQGELGDCYFLSALSVLAEKPHLIKNFFHHHIDNKYGAYCVTLYCDGVERDVLLDDYFPCDADTREPVFSKNKGPELWVLLLEKAYAKVHGSYDSISSGATSDALSDLTGAPCFVQDVVGMSQDEIWNLLTLHTRLDHIVGCGVKKTDYDLQDLFGLVQGHAYALLDAKEYRGNKLIRLRNPWGDTEWKGEWSDSDTERWTPEAKRALHYVDADDGNFWMPLDCWELYFDDCCVLFLEDGWHFTSFSLNVTEISNFLSLTISEPTELYLTCNLAVKSISCRICVVESKYPYYPLGGSDELFKLSNSISTSRIRLPPGKFLVILDIFDEDASLLPKDIAISCYSSSSGACISDELDEELTAASKEALFSLPSYEEKYGLCDTCGTPLGPVQSFTDYRKFHPYCWKCHYCGDDLGESFFNKDYEIACEDCYDEKKKIRGKPAAVKLQEKIKREREGFNRACLPKVSPAVMHHRECEAEQEKRKTFSPDDDDLMKLCKEQEKSAKQLRKKMSNASIRRAFSAADFAHVGFVEDEGIESLMISVGIPLSFIPKVKDLQIKFILNELDENRSGKIDFKEFSYWIEHTDLEGYSKRLIYIEGAAIFFLQYLKDGSEEIHTAEMKSLHAGLVKAKLTKLSYREFAKEIDEDESGTVSFTEYINWLEHNRSN